jgi:hypothetical protein
MVIIQTTMCTCYQIAEKLAPRSDLFRDNRQLARPPTNNRVAQNQRTDWRVQGIALESPSTAYHCSGHDQRNSLVFASRDDHLDFMIINSTAFHPHGPNDSRIHAPSPVESVPAKRIRCPNCNLPAIAPRVSTYLRECVVENDWVCSACGFEWSSRFNWLLV